MIVNKYNNGSGGGSGSQGPQGYQGPQGPQGINGQDGAQGPQGPAGSGGTGDSFILKCSSGTPENLEYGDVYAMHILPFSGDMTSVSVNDDISSYKAKKGLFYFDSQVSACYGIEANGDWRGLCYDGSNWNNWNGVFCNPSDGNCTIEFSGLKVAIYLEGDYLVYEIIEGDGYISKLMSNENVSAYVIYNVVEEDCKVFQTNIKSEPNVEIELEGNARVDGTLDNPTQIVTMGDGQMKISFYDATNWDGNVCDLESYGNYFHLYYQGLVDAWTLYDSDGENILIKITDGESDSADFGDGNVYLSYSGGVLTAYTDNEKGWQNWEMGDTHEVVIANELARAEDLPTKNQLLPQGWNAAEVLMSNGSEETPIWFGRGSLIVDGMREAYDYQEGNGPMVFERENYWDIGWKKLDKTVLNAKDELPVQGEDGAVYALSSSGYGIYQAQSAHTGYNWFNLVDKTFPHGVVTKVRVPYNDNGESNIVHIKTDPNGSGEMNYYWHPEESWKHWDISDPNGMNQYNDEFTLTDYWGNSVAAVKVGDYIELTFGAPIYEGDDTISTYRNTEVYTEGDITDYRRVAFYDEISGGGGGGAQGPQGPQGPAGADGADGKDGADGAQGPQGPMPSGAVTSSTITTIWSGSQSDYNNLGTYDNNTFYVII